MNEVASCFVFAVPVQIHKHIFINVTMGHFVVQILTVLSFVQFKLKLNFYIYIFALFALCALVMYTHMRRVGTENMRSGMSIEQVIVRYGLSCHSGSMDFIYTPKADPSPNIACLCIINKSGFPENNQFASNNLW
jgi:hypothetical protein